MNKEYEDYLKNIQTIYSFRDLLKKYKIESDYISYEDELQNIENILFFKRVENYLALNLVIEKKLDIMLNYSDIESSMKNKDLLKLLKNAYRGENGKIGNRFFRAIKVSKDIKKNKSYIIEVLTKLYEIYGVIEYEE